MPNLHPRQGCFWSAIYSAVALSSSSPLKSFQLFLRFLIDNYNLLINKYLISWSISHHPNIIRENISQALVAHAVPKKKVYLKQLHFQNQEVNVSKCLQVPISDHNNERYKYFYIASEWKKLAFYWHWRSIGFFVKTCLKMRTLKAQFDFFDHFSDIVRSFSGLKHGNVI